MACTLCRGPHPKFQVRITVEGKAVGPVEAEYCASLGGWFAKNPVADWGVSKLFFPNEAVEIVEEVKAASAAGKDEDFPK